MTREIHQNWTFQPKKLITPLEDAFCKGVNDELMVVDGQILSMPDCTLTIKKFTAQEIEIHIDQQMNKPVGLEIPDSEQPTPQVPVNEQKPLPHHHYDLLSQRNQENRKLRAVVTVIYQDIL